MCNARTVRTLALRQAAQKCNYMSLAANPRALRGIAMNQINVLALVAVVCIVPSVPSVLLGQDVNQLRKEKDVSGLVRLLRDRDGITRVCILRSAT